MKNKKIIIGSRGSKLALIYAERARVELLKNPEIESIDIKSITTTGDTITDVRLSEHGGKGLFCKTKSSAAQHFALLELMGRPRASSRRCRHPAPRRSRHHRHQQDRSAHSVTAQRYRLPLLNAAAAAAVAPRDGHCPHRPRHQSPR